VTIGQVIVVIALMAQVYGAPAARMDCVVGAESSYQVDATNGIHRGLGQYRPDTFDWFVFMALQDPLFVHAEIVRANPDPADPVVALAIMAWAMAHGYGEHWSTWTLCGGE
jgi:hypothetical protein